MVMLHIHSCNYVALGIYNFVVLFLYFLNSCIQVTYFLFIIFCCVCHCWDSAAFLLWDHDHIFYSILLLSKNTFNIWCLFQFWSGSYHFLVWTQKYKPNLVAFAFIKMFKMFFLAPKQAKQTPFRNECACGLGARLWRHITPTQNRKPSNLWKEVVTLHTKKDKLKRNITINSNCLYVLCDISWYINW